MHPAIEFFFHEEKNTSRNKPCPRSTLPLQKPSKKGNLEAESFPRKLKAIMKIAKILS
jgi:hypothetical protein